MVGTLQKFRQDESKIKDREQKKRKIEEKIEEKSVKEREDAKLKKRELFTEREKKKHEVKVLEVINNTFWSAFAGTSRGDTLANFPSERRINGTC